MNKEETKEYSKLYMRKYREQDYVRFRAKAYIKRSKDRRKKKNAEWYLRNKSVILEKVKKRRQTKHGKIMLTLQSVNGRCYDPKNNSFKWYGAKGIQNYLTYEDLSFLYDRDKPNLMKKPSIDRIDADKDYVFGNCQFIELAENVRKAQKGHFQIDTKKNIY